MKVSVYDTYVARNEKQLMHFDILVEEQSPVDDVHNYGKAYLASKGLSDHTLSTRECRFCHVEMAPMEVELAIKKQGYFILEMENCD